MLTRPTDPLQVVEALPAEAMFVRLQDINGSAAAQLDGFKSRVLRAGGEQEQRRWLYEIEWPRVYDQILPPDGLDVLVIDEAPDKEANKLTQKALANSKGNGPMLGSGFWHAVLLTTSLRAVKSELPVIGTALHLLQSQATLELPPPVWICTRDTQSLPSLALGRCTHAGLWGLARTCRQEIFAQPACCIDVQGVQASRSLSAMCCNTLRLSGGTVRGLQVTSSVEPEAASASATLLVPRLVMPYGSQPSSLAVSFEAAHNALNAYALQSMAGMDTWQLSAAYELLEALCHWYVTDALRLLHDAAVKAWHHKLLYAWCANQSAHERSASPSDVCEAHPDLWPEAGLAEQCGPRFAHALLGTVAYQELLFPGGSMDVLLPMYKNSVVLAYYNGCVIAAVKTALTLLPSGRRVVVLEVGAGTGGTASSLLPLFDGARDRYIFTDVSDVFLTQAKVRFASYTLLEHRLLNIDADPRLQGFASYQCGICIATNVLHATPSMRNTLHHCQQLLCTGGVLVANEATYTSALVQITFGMTDGWWLFSESGDPERVGQDSPLMSRRQWESSLAECNFDQTVYMQGGAFLRGQAVILARAAATPLAGAQSAAGSGAHLLTGGLGGLALLTARLLIESGARQLVLSSRTDRVVSGSDVDWAWLASYGGDVRRMRFDVSDAANTCAASQLLKCDALRLSGLFHAAHMLADAILANQTVYNFRATYSPKVHGSLALHAALWDTPLYFFNVYSSIAGALGSRGQAPHSAATAWLNSMAGCRNRLGLAGQSVAWGAVAEIGYAARHGVDKQANASGLGAISRAVAATALSGVLDTGSRSFLVFPAEWPLLLAGGEAWGLLTPYAHLGLTQAQGAPMSVGTASVGVVTTSSIGLARVLDLVRSTAGGAAGAFDADAPLMEAGVDSLGAVQLRTQLQNDLGKKGTLPSTVVFDHPTARALAMLFETATPVAVCMCDERTVAADGAVRIASIRAALPGGAQAPLRALRLASTGGVVITLGPAMRWEHRELMQSVRYGAFLDGGELFDSTAFGISAPETTMMDPQQRFLLEVGYEALHASGLKRSEIADSNVAVYVGVTATEFKDVLLHVNAYFLTGTGHCFAAGRLSYVLGLHGPCEAIDVACSSALVACHHAHRAMQIRDCREGLVAGVNMMLIAEKLDVYATGGLTATSGKACVFDARADGFVLGEGCSAGALGAVASTDSSVVGSAVRQDGRSASLTAPNGRAQQLLLSAALTDASTVPGQLRLMEAAANGAALGDPIEIGAVVGTILAPREQVDSYPTGARHCLPLGAGKANMGHAESASGMVGLWKLQSAMRRAQAAPNAQLLVLSAHVANAITQMASCVLPLQLAAAPLRQSSGTVCSFGLGGTIASAVLGVAALDGDRTHATHAFAFRRCSFPWQRLLRVLVERKGAISGMVQREQPAFTAALADGELEVQVRTVGLNFRDLLLVLDEYPGPSEPPGSDCSAICVAGPGCTSPKTTRIRRGAELFGIVPGCLSFFVRARPDARLMVRRPLGTGAGEACSLPTTWSTVYEVVLRAHLCLGQRFLLHAAAGGVGFSATEYLSWLRVPVSATAGQAYKHRLLSGLGIAASCSSRNAAAFTVGLTHRAACSRLHSTCNSLIDDFVASSAASMGEDSSFHEIGKQ